jgi:photosystem II stability/assembly factor-like uncharacterized protein
MSARAGRCPSRSRRNSRTGARWALLEALAAATFAALLASSPAAARAVTPAPGRAAAPATSPGWSVRASYPNPVTSLTGIACPAAKTCYSVGTLGSGAVWSIYGAAVKTTDGSAWAEQNLPVPFSLPIGSLAGVACPSVSTCYAVGIRAGASGPAVLATTDGGTKWSSQLRAHTPGVDSLAAVACPSARTCYAVGAGIAGSPVGAVMTTTDGGAAWGSSLLSSGVLDGVACPSVSVCYAVGSNVGGTGGQVLVTTDSGSTFPHRGYGRGCVTPSRGRRRSGS